MTTDPQFRFPAPDLDQREKKRSAWTTCLIGCLAAVGVMLICVALVGFWVMRNWRGWAADAMSQVVDQGVNEMQLPDDEKQEIKVQANRVIDALRDGSLSGEQAGRILERFLQSPLMPAFVVLAADKQYLEKSGLSDEEKAEGRLALQRFANGVIKGKIPEQSVDAVLSHVADRAPGGEWELRQQVSDEDLRAALAEARSHADEANVPAEPEMFDPSDEIKKVIDEGMREQAELE
jgi:hypothetical protein